MAVYFTRKTDRDLCEGCGECVDICPVDVVTIDDGLAEVDLDWCIGCGVCATRCDYDAIHMVYREDRKEPPGDFEPLHTTIIKEKNG